MFVLAKDLKTLKGDNGRYTCKDSFKVTEIEYIDDKIVFVKVLNLKTDKEIMFGTPADALSEQKEIEKSVISDTKVKTLVGMCKKDDVQEETILKLYKVKALADLNEKQFLNITQHWEDIKKVE